MEEKEQEGCEESGATTVAAVKDEQREAVSPLVEEGGVQSSRVAGAPSLAMVR